jgi:hypothetical protein
MRLLKFSLGVVLICIASLFAASDPAAPSPTAVRYKEGTIHGFLVLRTLEGDLLADGDMLQSTRNERITNRLIFHFKDGSLQDETTVFTQRGDFRLVSYHLVQKGPAFPHPLDLSIQTASSTVTVHTTDDKGEEKVITENLKLPPDLANGLVLTLLKNFAADAAPAKVSMVVATPKPRLIKLAIRAQGEEPFSLGGSSRKATHYTLKVEIGGVSGVVAPLIGKEPPDNSVWILGGEVPAFIQSESLSYMGGPLWRTELVSPVWPKPTAADSKSGDVSKR